MGVKQIVASVFNLDWLNIGAGGNTVPVTAGDYAPTPYGGGETDIRPYTHEGDNLVPGGGTADPFAWLGHWLAVGSQYHGPISDAFLGFQDSGYYHYERQRNWLTCAVAAAYAGAFGKESVEGDQSFSPSSAKWRLSHLLGVDLDGVVVTGPTGRTQPVLDEMIDLMDKDGWSREVIAEWLTSQGGQ